MREFAACSVRRSVVRVALTGLVGAWLAGCSVDSDRFAQSYAPASDPFTSPFASASSEGAPTSDVAAAPLAPPGAVAAAAIPPAQSQVPAPTMSRFASSAPVGGSAAGWSVVGGSPIVVAQGDDVESLSRRYGVPSAALLKSNGLNSASQVRGGMHIIVPVYNAGDAPSGAKTNRIAAADGPEAAPPTHKAKPAKEESADVEPAAKPKAKTTEKTADKPAAKTPGTQVAEQSDAGTTTAKKTLPDATPTSSVRPGDTSAPLTNAQADAAGVAPEFRWPARGRIIDGFKAGGNEGINIAVPEGTSVRAAESGVVAYAGDELKGYGNLVLIRHPNGFVTAYANNGELDVKRGDTVKRGQIIAKSGQTGNVNSPQLHFELRKGSTPVDPTSYLAGL